MIRVLVIDDSLTVRNALSKYINKAKDIEVVGVATKSKSDFNSDHSDISDIAIINNLPWKYVKDKKAPHIIKWITQLNPDVIFCFGWSSLISAEIWDFEVHDRKQANDAQSSEQHTSGI